MDTNQRELERGQRSIVAALFKRRCEWEESEPQWRKGRKGTRSRDDGFLILNEANAEVGEGVQKRVQESGNPLFSGGEDRSLEIFSHVVKPSHGGSRSPPGTESDGEKSIACSGGSGVAFDKMGSGVGSFG